MSTHRAMLFGRTRLLALVVALLLSAFALRMFRLDSQSLWWDEGISLHLATSSLAEIVRDRLNNIHPPLYFVLLKGWLALVGVSPFTARLFSVFGSLFQVALVYATMRVLGGASRPSLRRAAVLTATVLVALSPLSIIYGQEVRVYAFLPLAYLMMVLFAERLFVRQEPALRLFVFLALTEWTALHLHYIALFGVAVIGAWGVVHYWRRREGRLLRYWLLANGAVALASLPWFVAMVGNWPAIQAEASAGTFTTDPVPLPFLFAQVWAFQLTGLAGSLAEPLVRWLAASAAVLVVALIIYRAARTDDDRLPRGRTLALWAVPLVSALIVWAVRSFSHPRYVVMYTILFFPFVAAILLPARKPAARLLVALLATCLLGLSLWGLRQYYFVPGAAKPDMRGVAAYLESVTTADDLIVVPDTDWSLPFEYDGPAPILMPGWGKSPPGNALDASFSCSSPSCTPERVFVVDYTTGTRDWQNRLPFELERRGALVGSTPFDDLQVHEYQATAAPGPIPACAENGDGWTRVGATFGPLRLVGVWVEPAAESNSAVAVALCWEKLPGPAERLSSTLVLRDLTGERLGQVDTPLLDAQGRPTDLWPAGDHVRTYHLLPLEAGTPPLTYELAAGIYADDERGLRPLEVSDDPAGRQGQIISISDVMLAPPRADLDNPYRVADPALYPEKIDIGNGLTLAGAAFAPGPYRPGQTVRVRLWWRGDETLAADLRPTLSLEQAGAVLASTTDPPAQGRYPTEAWTTGELISEVRDLRLPAGADGTVEIVVTLGDRRHVIGSIVLNGADVDMTPPSPQIRTDVTFGDLARLVGYDLPSTDITGGEPVTVTLYWESLRDGALADYTVFTHLVTPDGRLVGQHDSVPADGARPTGDWLRGEFITDTHVMEWKSPAPVGPATISVGLYDPTTGERLPTSEGDESYTLPDGLVVRPRE